MKALKFISAIAIFCFFFSCDDVHVNNGENDPVKVKIYGSDQSPSPTSTKERFFIVKEFVDATPPSTDGKKPKITEFTVIFDDSKNKRGLVLDQIFTNQINITGNCSITVGSQNILLPYDTKNGCLVFITPLSIGKDQSVRINLSTNSEKPQVAFSGYYE